MSTAQPATQLLHSWEANAQSWSEAVRSGQIESRRLVTDAAILAAIEACQPDKMLDLGCGEGWLSQILHGKGYVCVGVDASAALIALAREKNQNPFLQLSYADITEAPTLCGTDYDLIVANFSLLEETLQPLLQALPQLGKANCQLLIQTLHPCAVTGVYQDGWRNETFEGFGSGNWTPMPWYFRTVGSWLRLLHNSGWQLQSLDEPVHPETGKPLSLLLRAQLLA